MAEWLGNGLQIRVPRFNSARRLQPPSRRGFDERAGWGRFDLATRGTKPVDSTRA